MGRGILKKIVPLVCFSFLCGFIFATPSLEKVDSRIIGSKTRMIISLSEPTSYHIATLSSPLRIVINFSEKIASKSSDQIDFFSGIVKAVRFITRKDAGSGSGILFLDAAVVELEANSKFEVFKEGSDIVIDAFGLEEGDSLDNNIDKEEVRSGLISAKSNYDNGYYLLAKSDCENVLSVDSGNKEAKELLVKINEKVEAEKEDAEILAAKLSKDKTAEIESQKADAANLAEILEKEKTEDMMNKENFDEYVKMGKNLFKKKRYEEAVEIWERALSINSEDAELIDLIAKARENIKLRRIQITGEEVMSEHQSEIESLMTQGKEEFTNLNYGAAISSFEKILTLDSNNLGAMRYLAQAKRRQMDYTEDGGQAEDVAMIAETIGGKDLGVLNVEDVIKIGVSNHLPTKIAQEEVILAKAKVRDARRELFPKLKLKYKDVAGTTTGEDFEGEEYSAEFQQNIYAGGKYKALYNQARVNLAVARKNYEKTKAEFVFEVTQAYYNLAFAKEKMKNKLELLNKTKELLGIAEKQYDAKALTLSEILEARSQMEEVILQVQEIENDLELANLALLQLLTLRRNTILNTIPMPDPIIFDLNTDKLVEVAIKNRRDYQVKKLLVLFNRYGLDIANKKQGFNVELTGSYGQRDEYYISEAADLQDEYYLGVKVSKPLGAHVVEYNGIYQDKVPQVGQTTSTEFNSNEVALKLWEYKEHTSLAEANIAYHKAISELENEKREMVHDINSSFYSVKEAEYKINNKKSLVSFAAEELRSTRAKQQVEQSTIVQVMRAESKLWGAKTDLVSSKADYYVSIAKLNKNIGVNNYFDPTGGVVSTDLENLTPGIRLHVKEKGVKKHWYNLAGDGISSYYPDEVVTDVLKEKQEEEVFGKSFFNFFKKKDKEFSEYKVYDEKYDFTTPQDKEKKSFWPFSKKKIDDDFSKYYATKEEYNQAFDVEKKEEKTTDETKKIETFVSNDESDDLFASFLEDESKNVFAEYYIEENQYDTTIVIRTNSKVKVSASVLKEPYRIVITFKDVVISALKDFDTIGKGNVKSLKAFHTTTVLPAKFRDWKRLLSLIIELDSEKKYHIESTKNTFKIIIKK